MAQFCINPRGAAQNVNPQDDQGDSDSEMPSAPNIASGRDTSPDPSPKRRKESDDDVVMEPIVPSPNIPVVTMGNPGVNDVPNPPGLDHPDQSDSAIPSGTPTIPGAGLSRMQLPSMPGVSDMDRCKVMEPPLNEEATRGNWFVGLLEMCRSMKQISTGQPAQDIDIPCPEVLLDSPKAINLMLNAVRAFARALDNSNSPSPIKWAPLIKLLDAMEYCNIWKFAKFKSFELSESAVQPGTFPEGKWSITDTKQSICGDSVCHYEPSQGPKRPITQILNRAFASNLNDYFEEETGTQCPRTEHDA